MNRRTFARSVAGALASAPLTSVPAFSQTDRGEPPYKLSVMLWTVYRDLPFEQRLEKVAEAGYKNVELVGEYDKWSDADFDKANAKRKELGMTFDCTAGMKHSLCDPAQRGALLSEFRNTLPVMERLDCPAMIFLTGDRVPGMSDDAQAKSCIEGLTALTQLVDGKKINGEPVRILLENIDPEENPKYFLTSVAKGFDIVRAVNHSQVQFLYDFFHEQIAEGNLIEKLEKNIEHVGLVHVADVPGRHHPGTGEINYENIFRKLTELNYKKIVAMEFMPVGDPIEELRSAKKMVLAAGSTRQG